MDRTNQRKVYTDEFIGEAVRLANERGNGEETARALGIADNLLYRWKQRLQIAKTGESTFPGQGTPRDEEIARLKKELARVLLCPLAPQVGRGERHPRKGSGHLPGCTPATEDHAVRCRFIQAQSLHFPVAALCRVLQVSQSSYYAWRSPTDSLRALQNRQLTETIQSLFAASRQTYGSPRIHADLKAMGIACGVHRVARLMRRASIRPVLARRFVVTTDSNHDLPVAQNCLGRGFTAEKANARWVSDITYLWTSEGWLYLAVVLDLFSRRIVGWSLAPTLHKAVVLNALEMAMQGRRAEAGLLVRSDRGSQYASLAYQERLLQAGVTCSMSRKGDCWDNAAFAVLGQRSYGEFLYDAETRAGEPYPI